jgi:hypothetical protein
MIFKKIIFDNIMTKFCLQYFLFIILRFHDNFAHAFDSIMTIFVFVFIHIVLTICEIILSNFPWQFLCLCLLIMFWLIVKLFSQICDVFFFFWVCLYLFMMSW